MWRYAFVLLTLANLDCNDAGLLRGRSRSRSISNNFINDSPCPENFQYFYQNGELKYGAIQIECPAENVITLNVQISVGNPVQGFNGNLELAANKEEAVNLVLQRSPLNYRLFFPRWFNQPPKVTKIQVNGRVICSGPPINIKLVQVLTTVNLQHTLRVNVPSTSLSNGFQNNNGFQSNNNGFQSNNNGFQNNNDDFQGNSAGGFQSGSNTGFQNNNGDTQNTDIQNNGFQNGGGGFHNGGGGFQNGGGQNNNGFQSFDEDLNEFFNVNTRTTTQRPFVQFTTTRRHFVTTPTPPMIMPEAAFPVSDNFGVNAPVCGLSVTTNALVAHGQDVVKGEYPWLVAIFRVQSLGPEFLCGGSLISDKHVITAGHCMKISDRVLHVEKVFLRLGEHNIHRWTQMTGSRTVGVGKIVVHPDYRPMTSDGDVAVVILQESVEFTKLIRPICLWTEDLELSKIVGQLGTVVGWGKDESNSVITPEPKKVNFPVVSQETCLWSHLTFREITSQRTFCAGYKNGSGPCNGDSGGGFILKRGDRWTLRGIVSMSIAKDRTCDYSQYFVFTDITKFIDWIFKSIQE